MTALEERKLSPGHWHIEGWCALKAGRTWIVKQSGCQATASDNVNEAPVYRSSLTMVRDFISVKIYNF